MHAPIWKTCAASWILLGVLRHASAQTQRHEPTCVVAVEGLPQAGQPDE